MHAEDEMRAPLYRRMTLRLVPLLLLCLIISYIDRVNIGFAKFQMLKDLELSETVYGLGAGAFFIGYALFEIPSNIILTKVGARRWIGRIMVTWGIASVCMMFVRDAWSFYIARFFLGVAEAGFIPAILYYLTTWFPSAHRAKPMALFLAGVPLSGMIGGPLSSWLLASESPLPGLTSWQWMFLIEGLVTIVVGLACFVVLDDDAASARWLTDDEKRVIAADLASDTKKATLHSLRQGLASSRAWLLSATYFCFAAGLYGISFWLPTLIKDSGVKDVLNVGLLTAIPYTGALIAIFLVSRSSDARLERRWHLAGPAIVGGLGLAASVLVAQNTALALIALTVAAAGTLTCVPQFYTLAPTVLAGPAAASGLALANSIGSVAGFASPYLLGWVKDTTGSTGNGVLALAAALVIGASLVFLNPAKAVNR